MAGLGGQGAGRSYCVAASEGDALAGDDFEAWVDVQVERVGVRRMPRGTEVSEVIRPHGQFA